MFIKKRKIKDEDPFEKAFLQDCVRSQSLKETTHIQFKKTVGIIAPNIYKYNGNGTLSLDGEYICHLTLSKSIREATASGNLITLKHVPTFDELIEKGDIVDNRSKEVEED